MGNFTIATWDKTTIMVTFFSFALLVVISAIFLRKRNTNPLIKIFAFIIWIPFIIAFCSSPRNYFISEQEISIHRVFGLGNITIPKAKIESITYLKRVRPISRVSASGGLFGYFGTFIVKDLGEAQLYVTRLNNVVLIKTPQKLYVVSPTNPGKFIKVVKYNLETIKKRGHSREELSGLGLNPLINPKGTSMPSGEK